MSQFIQYYLINHLVEIPKRPTDMLVLDPDPLA